MRVFRRIIAASTLLCMLLALTNIPSYAQKDYSEQTTLLSNLEIYNSEDDMDLYADALTRETAASILSVFYGITEQEYLMETDFLDVSENWSSGHIMTMVNYGIMNGYDDGLFRPQRLLKVSEVIKMLVVMTGYDVMAEYSGGYPTGYMLAATKSGLLDGITVSDLNKEITKGEFTELLCNALEVEILSQVTVSDRSKFSSDEGRNLLSEYLDIYKADGILNALPYTTLDYSKAPGNNEIRIDNVNYECHIDAEPYLGTSVEAYYRQKSDETIGEVLHLETKENRTDTVRVEAEDILDVAVSSSGILFSYEDDGKTRNEMLPKDVVVIFNGVRMTYYEAEKHLKPAQGTVKLIDSDRDGTYEYAMVECFVNYFVGSITEESGLVCITDKNGKNPINVDTKSDDVYVRVYDRGREIAVEEISENDIISVLADSIDIENSEVLPTSTVIKIHLSDSKVKGSIDSYDDESIEIGGVIYQLAADFDRTEYELVTGEESTFYLNFADEVCAVETSVSSGAYAILQKIDVRSAIDDTVTLRMFDQSGIFFEAKCADDLRIDGRKEKDYESASEYLKASATYFEQQTQMGKNAGGGVWQLVKYELDGDGLVKSIDTLKADKSVSKQDLSYFGCAGSSNYYLPNAYCFSGKYGITNETVMFTVGNAADEDSYSLMEIASLNTGKNGVPYFFDSNDMQVASAVVIDGDFATTINTKEDNKLMVIERIATKANADGEAASFMCGVKLKDGSKIEVELDSLSLLDNGGSKIVPGDFVRWAAGGDGVATKLERIMDAGENGTPKTNFSYDVRCYYGTAKALDDSWLVTTLCEGTEVFDEPGRHYNVKNVWIYNSAKEKLTQATLDDIKTSDEYGSAADEIGIFGRAGLIRAIIIYR